MICLAPLPPPMPSCSGVIAAVLAAAGRLGTQEAEAAAALWAAAGEGSGSGSPLAALLTLDTTTQLGDSGRWAAAGTLAALQGSETTAVLCISTKKQLAPS